METKALPKLRPSSMAELLDQAIRIYRSNFLTFISIIAVVQIPATLLNLFFSLLTVQSTVGQMLLEDPTTPPPSDLSEIFTPGYFVGVGGTCIISVVASILLQGIATATLTWAVTDHYLGKSTSFIEAYRKTSRFWLRLAGAILLSSALSIALMIWLLIPCIGWFTGLGMILLFGQAITPLSALIIVVEEKRVLESIRRAWELVRRRFWWVVGFVTILFLFSQLIVAGPAFLVNILFLGAKNWLNINPANAQMIETTIQSLTSMIFSLIYLPLQLTGITLMYFDLRVRTEGFDLALLADGTTNLEDVLAITSMVRTKGLLTWAELGYFALLSIAAGVLLFTIGAAVFGFTSLILGGASGFGP